MNSACSSQPRLLHQGSVSRVTSLPGNYVAVGPCHFRLPGSTISSKAEHYADGKLDPRRSCGPCRGRTFTESVGEGTLHQIIWQCNAAERAHGHRQHRNQPLYGGLPPSPRIHKPPVPDSMAPLYAGLHVMNQRSDALHSSDVLLRCRRM